MILRTERSQIVEQEMALRKERRELGDRHHADEIRVRDMNHTLTTLNERLEEEYQLKLTDVVESGDVEPAAAQVSGAHRANAFDTEIGCSRVELALELVDDG